MIFLGAITKQTPSHDLHVRHRQLKGSARDVLYARLQERRPGTRYHFILK